MKTVALGSLMPKGVPSLDPSKHPDEIFELWSIPSFDSGYPEVITGAEIGSSKKCVSPNDVLLSRIVPHIRRSWVVDSNDNGLRKIASGEWIIFRSEKVYPSYLRHVLTSDPFHHQFMQTVAGVGGSLMRARPDFVKHIEIPLPPLTKQRRIAAILDKADAVRRKRKEAIALTENLLRSSFLEMFGDPVTNPKGWDIVSLEKTFERNPQIGATKPAHPDGEQLIVRVGEIGDRNIRLENCGQITLEDKDLEKNLCEPGDFLLARAIGSESHLGKASILQATNSVVVFDSHVMRLRFSEDKLLPEVFLTWLKTKGGRVRFMREAGRTAVQFNVNAKQISRVKIPLPPIALQREFMDIYKRLYLSLDKYERSRQIVEALFNSLLQRAFRGDL